MKKFILAASCFCALAVLLIGGACALEVGMEIVHYRRELQAPPEASVLVCGDSRTEVGLDPAHWPALFNFSASGRLPDQSFLTALDVLEANPNRFRTLLIDVSPENASADLTLPIGKMDYGGKYLLLYLLHPWDTPRAWSGVFRVFRDLMVVQRLHLISRMLRGKRTFHSSLYSGYCRQSGQSKVTRPDKFEASVCRQKRKTRPAMNGDDLSEAYQSALDRLVKLSHQRGLEPVLLTAPWHADLIARVGVGNVRRFTDSVARYASRRQCRYFNLMELTLPDEDWRDCNHLNFRGAEIFTRTLRRCVEGNRLMERTARVQ